jgi:hypothetical protein
MTATTKDTNRTNEIAIDLRLQDRTSIRLRMESADVFSDIGMTSNTRQVNGADNGR